MQGDEVDGLPYPYTGLRLIAAHRMGKAYPQDIIRSCPSDGGRCLSGEGKLPGVSLPDGGFVFFGTCL
jgi:hypothetical protein